MGLSPACGSSLHSLGMGTMSKDPLRPAARWSGVAYTPNDAGFPEFTWLATNWSTAFSTGEIVQIQPGRVHKVSSLAFPPQAKLTALRFYGASSSLSCLEVHQGPKGMHPPACCGHLVPSTPWGGNCLKDYTSPPPLYLTGLYQSRCQARRCQGHFNFSVMGRRSTCI